MKITIELDPRQTSRLLGMAAKNKETISGMVHAILDSVLPRSAKPRPKATAKRGTKKRGGVKRRTAKRKVKRERFSY